MSIQFPTNLDSLTNPTGTDLLENSNAALDHDLQHSNANDAIEALEAKVGADGSAVTTSHDYKLSEVTSTDKAVGKTATQTVTNKTLGSGTKVGVGSDAAGDTYYRASDGTLTRIPIGTSTYILTSDGSTPSWQANAAGSDASTTVKGVVELATLAETLARTTTGGTGAKLVVTPDNVTTVKSYDQATDSAGSDSYAITVSPAPTAYTTGMRFSFISGTANTGACTLNVNSLGAKNIKKNVSVDLSTGDILLNQVVLVEYDGTNFQMMSAQQPRPFYKSGTTTYNLATASGTQTIAHGLGVTPRFIRMTFMRTQSDIAGSSGIGNLHNGVGTFDGTTYATQYTGSDASSGATGNYSTFQSTSAIIVYNRGAGGSDVKQEATASLDATNITLNWTKTNSPTGELMILWEAFA